MEYSKHICPKLSVEQTRLLIWLSRTSTHLEIFRKIDYLYRTPNGLQSYVNQSGEPYKFDMRTLNKLVNENLVTSQFLYPFGIKHEHYFVTQAGKDFVSTFVAKT